MFILVTLVCVLGAAILAPSFIPGSRFAFGLMCTGATAVMASVYTREAERGLASFGPSVVTLPSWFHFAPSAVSAATGFAALAWWVSREHVKTPGQRTSASAIAIRVGAWIAGAVVGMALVWIVALGLLSQMAP